MALRKSHACQAQETNFRTTGGTDDLERYVELRKTREPAGSVNIQPLGGAYLAGDTRLVVNLLFG